jgi:hypothetical protein
MLMEDQPLRHVFQEPCFQIVAFLKFLSWISASLRGSSPFIEEVRLRLVRRQRSNPSLVF